MADDNTNPSDEAYLDKYVGEGKKYASVEDLAKAYAHAEQHIDRMKDDNGHLREEFDLFREFTTAQLLEQSKSGNETPTDKTQNEQSQSQKPDSSAPPKVKDDTVDLDARIAKVLEEKDEEKKFKDNARQTEEVLIKHFGSKEDAQKAVQARAAELGVSAQWLASTAFQSPQAFFATMNIVPEQPPKSTSTPNSSSDVNAQRLAQTNPGTQPGTYEYYQEIRRKDPRSFYSVEIQSKMMADAIRLGTDFYKK